jgi:hypothetical protein
MIRTLALQSSGTGRPRSTSVPFENMTNGRENHLEGLLPRRRIAAIARLHLAHPPLIAENRMPHAALVPHLLGRRIEILARR